VDKKCHDISTRSGKKKYAEDIYFSYGSVQRPVGIYPFGELQKPGDQNSRRPEYVRVKGGQIKPCFYSELLQPQKSDVGLKTKVLQSAQAQDQYQYKGEVP